MSWCFLDKQLPDLVQLKLPYASVARLHRLVLLTGVLESHQMENLLKQLSIQTSVQDGAENMLQVGAVLGDDTRALGPRRHARGLLVGRRPGFANVDKLRHDLRCSRCHQSHPKTPRSFSERSSWSSRQPKRTLSSFDGRLTISRITQVPACLAGIYLSPVDHSFPFPASHRYPSCTSQEAWTAWLSDIIHERPPFSSAFALGASAPVVIVHCDDDKAATLLTRGGFSNLTSSLPISHRRHGKVMYIRTGANRRSQPSRGTPPQECPRPVRAQCTGRAQRTVGLRCELPPVGMRR